jgi:hypothetical protein
MLILGLLPDSHHHHLAVVDGHSPWEGRLDAERISDTLGNSMPVEVE